MENSEEYNDSNNRCELYTQEDPGTERMPELAPESVMYIANASANAFNGPNGSEICKTLRHGLYITGGLVTLKMLLDFICQIRFSV